MSNAARCAFAFPVEISIRRRTRRRELASKERMKFRRATTTKTTSLCKVGVQTDVDLSRGVSGDTPLVVPLSLCKLIKLSRARRRKTRLRQEFTARLYGDHRKESPLRSVRARSVVYSDSHTFLLVYAQRTSDATS